MTILVNVGDTHVGSKAAICVPGYEIGDDDNKAPYQPNRAQEWLAACFADALAKVKRLARRQRVVLNLLGDLTDGDGHHGTRTTFGTPTEQADMAAELLLPWATMADRVIAVAGTEVHAGGEGEQDESAAKRLTADTRHHRRVEIDGRLFDIAHHCTLPKDSRLWPPAMARQAELIARNAIDRGERVPDMIIRGHVHRHARGLAHVGGREVRMMTNYGWQLRTPYMARVEPAALYAVGVTAVNCRDLETHAIAYAAKADPIEVIRLKDE